MRALLRVEAELLLDDARRLRRPGDVWRTPDNRRADAFVLLVLRTATGSGGDRILTPAIRKGEDILVPDVVRLELLAGAADEAAAHDLRRLLARCTAVPAASPADHDVAASL